MCVQLNRMERSTGPKYNILTKFVLPKEMADLDLPTVIKRHDNHTIVNKWYITPQPIPINNQRTPNNYANPQTRNRLCKQNSTSNETDYTVQRPCNKHTVQHSTNKTTVTPHNHNVDVLLPIAHMYVEMDEQFNTPQTIIGSNKKL